MLDRRVPPRSHGTLDDDELELFRSAPSPWAEAVEGLEPRPPPPKHRSPSEKNPSRRQLVPATGGSGAGGGHTSIRVVVGPLTTGKPFRPAAATNTSNSSNTNFLPVVPMAPNAQSPRQPSSQAKKLQLQRGRDASPLVQAYQALVEQANEMTASYEENRERRRLHEAALQLGIAQLSTDRVRQQRQHIRFNTIKNEVDIFQQYLDPFVFEMRSHHEHQVNSSVYRHFVRMQGVQEMGIPIYSLGNYMEEEFDRILTARTQPKLYRRIRRRDAAHYMDTELIPRLVSNKRRSSILLSATPVTGGSSSSGATN